MGISITQLTALLCSKRGDNDKVSDFDSLQVLGSDSPFPPTKNGVVVVRGSLRNSHSPVVIENPNTERTNAAAEGKKREEVHVETESVLGHSV